MRQYLYFFITLFLCAASLESRTDSERVAALQEIIAKDTKKISKSDLKWLGQQSVPLEPSAIVADYEEVKERLSRISKCIKKKSYIGTSVQNLGKNVHPKFAAIDETRVLRNISGFYISANEVLTPLQEYIVSQAPLETTICDFWRAVIETQTPTIIALCMPVDAGGRSPAYWEKTRFPLTIGKWTVHQEDGEEVLDTSDAISSQRVVKRRFMVTNEETKEERQIQHIHYENWPDLGAPEPKLFFRFINLVTKIHPVSSVPLWVHCSAGLGRSGTFVTSHSLCKEIQQQKPQTINIPERIIELRMQRPYLVSTTVQFEAIYEAVQTCCAIPQKTPDLQTMGAQHLKVQN